MISEGLSKTISFIVIFRRETWNCTAAALYFTRHLHLFLYFSSVVHVILRQGQTMKSLCFHFKTAELEWGILLAIRFVLCVQIRFESANFV